MKSTYLKKLIKEAVREAIQEELKDILLEAVTAPKKQIVEGTISSTQPSTPMFNQPSEDVKQRYADVMNDTAMSLTSKDVPKFSPQGADPVNGQLGGGELSMNQITNLLNSK